MLYLVVSLQLHWAAFQLLENDKSLPVGYKPATGHIVFDVKMDFTRKARWVLDGHRTADPTGSTYAGVVSRESVCIALTTCDTSITFEQTFGKHHEYNVWNMENRAYAILATIRSIRLLS